MIILCRFIPAAIIKTLKTIHTEAYIQTTVLGITGVRVNGGTVATCRALLLTHTSTQTYGRTFRNGNRAKRKRSLAGFVLKRCGGEE